MLYSFCSLTNCSDGSTPIANLIDVNGTLYGTTEYGGSYGYLAGTVFSLDLGTGTETVLYSFCRRTGCRDGNKPEAALLQVKGRLFGTTFSGDKGHLYGGVIFWVRRP